MKKYHKSADTIARLAAEQYRVTQESGTERPGTGVLVHRIFAIEIGRSLAEKSWH